jgi:hypothetical protein
LDIDLPRLCGAVERSRLALRRYRAERREAVRQFVGYHWANERTPDSVPVNLLALYVSVVGRNLISKEPRVMLSTMRRELKPAVSAMESWVNEQLVRTRFAHVIRRIVTDALFSIGIAKVALITPPEAAATAFGVPAGVPMISRVDLDDFVTDMHARDFDEVTFIGHRFRVPLDAVKDSKLYSRARKKLQPSDDALYNKEGDERIDVLGRGIYAGNDSEGEAFDSVDLWELYLPRHRQIITVADDQIAGPMLDSKGEPLRVQRWLGPDSGPYHALGLQTVPGNLMPKGPVMDLIDLHEAANKAYRKLIRTIGRVKETAMVQGGALEDGARVMNADDGEVVPVNNPDRIKQVVWGGQHAQTVMLIATTLKDLFSFMGGNLELLGGRAIQSPTAAQDEMLNASAHAGVADMQDQVTVFVEKCLRSLCWYWWNDPLKTMQVRHQLGAGLGITRNVTPQMRQLGKWSDLDVRIDPYSLPHQSPQQRLQGLNQLVEQIILPMLPILQQQGKAFDIDTYLRKVAKYMDQPDLAEIISVTEPPQPQSSGPRAPAAGQEMPSMGGRTRAREYVRRTAPGRTEKGNNMNLVNTLMGVNPGGNPSETKGAA